MAIEPNNSLPKREVRILSVKDILQVPAAIGQEHDVFVLFLALNASEVSNEDLRRVAQELIAQGLAYVCVWGDDCSRVHDQFDLERDENEQNGLVIMTTWHADETLHEAVELFRDWTWPDDGFARKIWHRIAVSWATTIGNVPLNAFLENEPRCGFCGRSNCQRLQSRLFGN